MCEGFFQLLADEPDRSSVGWAAAMLGDRACGTVVRRAMLHHCAVRQHVIVVIMARCCWGCCRARRREPSHYVRELSCYKDRFLSEFISIAPPSSWKTLCKRLVWTCPLSACRLFFTFISRRISYCFYIFTHRKRRPTDRKLN